MFPAVDILDFVDQEYLSLAKGTHQSRKQIIGIGAVEAKKAFVFEVDLIERLLAQCVGQLRQQRGFANPT